MACGISESQLILGGKATISPFGLPRYIRKWGGVGGGGAPHTERRKGTAWFRLTVPSRLPPLLPSGERRALDELVSGLSWSSKDSPATCRPLAGSVAPAYLNRNLVWSGESQSQKAEAAWKTDSPENNVSRGRRTNVLCPSHASRPFTFPCARHFLMCERTGFRKEVLLNT